MGSISVLRPIVMRAATAFALFSVMAAAMSADPYSHVQQPLLTEPTSNGAPKIEVFIMSKCPDAKDCVEELIYPAMKELGSSAELDFEFIGKSTADGGVACKHGPTECLGNVLHICAQEEYPGEKALDFSACLLHDYPLVPEKELVQACANASDMDFQKINTCAAQPETLEKLRDSFDYTAAEKVTTSCTIRVKGETVCVRDSGKWIVNKGCSVKNFVKRVKGA